MEMEITRLNNTPFEEEQKRFDEATGIIYIIQAPTLPDHFKLGFSERIDFIDYLKKRYGTYYGPISIEFYVCKNVRSDEKRAHLELESYKYSGELYYNKHLGIIKDYLHNKHGRCYSENDKDIPIYRRIEVEEQQKEIDNAILSLNLGMK